MPSLKLQRHPDKQSGYLVKQGSRELGVIWYAYDCRCWFANADAKATRPDWSLGSFKTKKSAAQALS